MIFVDFQRWTFTDVERDVLRLLGRRERFEGTWVEEQSSTAPIALSKKQNANLIFAECELTASEEEKKIWSDIVARSAHIKWDRLMTQTSFINLLTFILVPLAKLTSKVEILRSCTELFLVLQLVVFSFRDDVNFHEWIFET